MGVGQTGPGLWQEFYFFPKTTAAALHPGAGRAVVRYALLFFFFLRVGFGQFADIHRRIPEGDARFWLLPGLFSPAPCGRAKDSPAIWPRSLTYNSKKAQNPQRRQRALSATSAGQIHCVLGSWGAGGPRTSPGACCQWPSPWRPALHAVSGASLQTGQGAWEDGQWK